MNQPGEHVQWLSQAQRVPEPRPADAPRLNSLLDDAEVRRVETLEQWQRRREEIRRWWLDFLKPLQIDREGPPRFEVLAEDRPEGVVRQLVRYEVEPGQEVEAYLLKPAAVQRACPGVVAFHSTVRQTIRQPAGVKGRPEKAFGLRMARRGYVTFCPRCFLWSESLRVSYAEHARRFSSRHPGSKGMAKMLFDAKVALDILAGLPEVDPQRLGAVGHSLGAKQVLYLAALDERVQVAASSEGGIGTRFSNWHAPWYLGKEIRRGTFHHEHHELLALVAPRAFLLVGGDSADGDRSWPFIEAVLPIYRLYGGTARIGLFNHRKGHRVPREAVERSDKWFDVYL